MSASGAFTLITQRIQDPTPEWPGFFGRTMANAGATGNQVWTDNSSTPNLNGFGMQIAVPGN